MKYSIALLVAICAALPVCCRGGNGVGSPNPSPGASVSTATPEIEPNDSVATATPLGTSTIGTGSLATAGDVDYWSFSATAGQDLSIEVFAGRLDQSAWGPPADPIVTTILAVDGTTTLRKTSALSPAYSRDHEIAAFRVPTTGTYYLRFAPLSGGGTHGKYAFRISVLNLPNLQEEAESPGATGVNDTPATAQAITPGTVHGYHLVGNPDCYSFSVAQPTIVALSIDAYRLELDGANSSLYDSVLELVSSDQVTVLKSNDNNVFLDSSFRYQINTPGTYYVRVTEAASSTVSAPYYLTLRLFDINLTETEPNNSAGSGNLISYDTVISGTVVAGDDDYFRWMASAGDMVQVYYLAGTANVQGAPATIPSISLSGPGSSSFTFPLAANRCGRAMLRAGGEYALQLSTSSVTPVPYTIHLVLFRGSPYEVEPNDTPGAAQPLPTPQRIAGGITVSGDADVFSFTASAGEFVLFDVYAAGLDISGDEAGFGSSLIAVVSILDSVGTPLSTVDISNTAAPPSGSAAPNCDGIAFIAPSSGTFYIRIVDKAGGGAINYDYCLERR
jgi:hypothetical protein